MRVAVLTSGTRGAVQPYLALARAFRQAGHEVVLGAPRLAEFARSADELGVPFTPLGPAFDGMAVARVVDRAGQARLPLSEARVFFEALQASVDDMYDDCRELVRWSEVVVANYMQLAGRIAAERLGRPFVSGWTPWCELPTRYRPPGRLPNLGPLANRLLWAVLDRYADALIGRGLNRVRRRYALPSIQGLIRHGLHSPDLNLIGVSRHVIPRMPDWSPCHQVTGYWFLRHADWLASPELEEFLRREPKPVAISFGSMVSDDPRALTGLLARAVDQSGLRAVLQGGWAGLGEGGLSPSIFVAGEIPHDWLFPRVAAAIHHAGAGTMAAALKAGIPSVLVPHIPEQRRWARRAMKLGVAPEPIPRRRLTAERLASAIKAVTGSGAMRARAAGLGAAIRREDGVGTAVGLVEDYVACALPAGHASLTT